MSPLTDREALQLIRPALARLAERFELNDAEQGVVAVIPVVGGVFFHPLTREQVRSLKVYAAGPDRVKILEPRILRSLPAIPLTGLEHPSQFCAVVARTLGAALQELGRIRDAVAAMGITLDLERDVLKLRGRLQLQGLDIELCTSRPGVLEASVLGGRNLAGVLTLEERTVKLTGQVTVDLDQLARLGTRLGEKLNQLPPPPPPPEPPPAPGSAAVGPVPLGEAAPAALDVSDVVELTEAVEDVAGKPAEAAGVPELLPQSVPVAPSPAAAEPVRPENPAAPAASPPVPAAPPTSAPPEESAGPLKLKDLLDRLGSDIEISAHGGRLRLVVPLKVLQGVYTIYLEQRRKTQFTGVIASAKGARFKVDVDLATIIDIKDVFDRVVLGR